MASFKMSNCCGSKKKMCDKLFTYFRVYKQRFLTKKNMHVGPTLTSTRRGVLRKILNDKKNLKSSNKR